MEGGGFYFGVLVGVVGDERARAASGQKLGEEEVLDKIEEWFGEGKGSEEEKMEFMRKGNLLSPEENQEEAKQTKRDGVDKISRRLFATDEVAGSPLNEFDVSP